MNRVRGFAAYRPQARTFELIENVQTILIEMAEYLPLTLRQVFYRLVVKEQLGKTENEYARLCEVCNRARRGSWIDFEDIRDDGLTEEEDRQAYVSLAEFIRGLACES